MGNGEAKELICISQVHELRGWGMLVEGGYKTDGSKGETKWDNYNSVTNKIYFKKEIKKENVLNCVRCI